MRSRPLKNMLAALFCLIHAPAHSKPISPAAILSSQGSDSSKVVAQRQADVEGLWNGALIAASKLDYPLAEIGLRNALVALQRSNGDPDSGQGNGIYLDLALVVAAQGRLAEADALFDRASPGVEASTDPSERARLSGYRARLSQLKGDRIAARAFAAEAVERWRAIAEPGPGLQFNGAARAEFAMALNAEARQLLHDGELTSATVLASEALLQLDKAPHAPKWWRGEVLANLGEINIAAGRIAAAEKYFKTAIDQRRAIFGEGSDTLRMRFALGSALAREGLNTAAIVTYRQAFAALRASGNRTIRLTADQLEPMLRAVTALAVTLDKAADRQGLMAEAHDAFQLASDASTDDAIARSAERMAVGNPSLAIALRASDDAELELLRRRAELARLQSVSFAERNNTAELAAAAAVVEQQKLVEALDRKRTSEFPDYHRLTERRRPTLDELRARIGPEEAVASFLIGKTSGFIEIVRRDSATVAPIGLTYDGLADAVAQLRRGLDVSGRSTGLFDLRESYALYRALFGETEQALKGVKRLIVVPSGPLNSLPLAVLVRDPPRDADFVGAHWLIRDMALVRSPSAYSFIRLRATRPLVKAPWPLLAFANPVLGTQLAKVPMPTTLGPLDPCGVGQFGLARELARLQPLPETEQEVSAAASLLGASRDAVLIGASASKSVLRQQRLSEYRMIYFATHALLPGELPCAASGGIVLSLPQPYSAENPDDGLLVPSDISSLTLNAELVILSACNTGRATSDADSSVAGIAEAFFHAGARSLLVTHWQVPSRATAGLMISLFERLHSAPHDGVEDALRSAQLSLITNPTTPAPVFWGAFELLGAGANNPLRTELQ